MIVFLSHMSAIQYWLSPKAQRFRVGSASQGGQLVSFDELLELGPEEFSLAELPKRVVCSARKNEVELVAERYGLGVPLFASVFEDAARRRSASLVSRRHPIRVSRSQYVFVEPGLWVASPELALFQAASILDSRSDFAEMVSLCGQFFSLFLLDEAEPSGLLRRRPISSVSRCLSFLESCGYSRSATAGFMRRAVCCAVENAASPPEMILGLLASTPFHLGGYGMKDVTCNHRVDTSNAFSDGLPHYRFCDVYVPAYRLALEYQGRGFHEGRLNEDSQREVELAAVGVEVIPVVRDQLVRFELCEQLMVLAAARKGHRPDPRLLRCYASVRRSYHSGLLKALQNRRWSLG